MQDSTTSAKLVKALGTLRNIEFWLGLQLSGGTQMRAGAEEDNVRGALELLPAVDGSGMGARPPPPLFLAKIFLPEPKGLVSSKMKELL